MYTFKDYYHNKVELSFQPQPFSAEPKHVWVICRYRDQWLLTHHLRRGLEFPGGKVEPGETPEEAAVREVREETGGIVSHLEYLGQYKVSGKDKIIIKNIYFAVISDVQEHTHHDETKGSVLLDELPANLKDDKRFSFIMRDDVLVHSLVHVPDNAGR
ncbi:RNA deprotection pyrophosphohydrolase [Ectobacillus ponti]|uniref:Nucleoside triphosphatase YtkD n=1 Tax=Ectobacillus ponti TaxID=2961894 RepID=A0AA41X8Y7_9BACI|nr:nucleoside triphosphatase YtkD [Ectobacillus ponti]MCP8967576.1 nucleoside triphosphatase YtkD [Ectobacillus ponti]